eukprot:TRINITY_DN8483_c0_g1_i2.p1 TRINITY_DN8483_c0_g1~~TRINITY_DN8483_c0_g1_i2.p1  ORF type:complete len:746 (-),score=204.41 TRINITY_DN8483_c0_g1_i2:84-2321(-)
MFLFRRRQPELPGGSPAATVVSGSAGGNNAESPCPSSDKPAEFLAFKAARFIGGAARQMGASLAKLTAGPSAETLRADLEGRASGQKRDVDFAATLGDWSRQLNSPDDSIRYENPGGQPLTFRAVFLSSRSFELAVSAVAHCNGSILQSEEGLARWHDFLEAACLAKGEEAAAELPDLLATTRHFPDCRRWVDEAALALKADAKSEQLRCERTAAGARAEELRSAVRSGESSLDVACLTSREAIKHYAWFRKGLMETMSHLWDGVMKARLKRMEVAREALEQLGAEADRRANDAADRREEALDQREMAVAQPRRAIEALERDSARLQVDERLVSLETEKRQLQMELEEVSQALAAQRDARMAVMRRREAIMAEYRSRADVLERQLREHRPSQFHRAVAPRAAAMTEGEILSGYGKTTDALQALMKSSRDSADMPAERKTEDLQHNLGAVRDKAMDALQEHAQVELARIDAAGSLARSAISALLEGSRSRAAYAAMGLPAGEKALPSRREVRKLQRALAAAEEAMQEVESFWRPAPGRPSTGGAFPGLKKDQEPADWVAALAKDAAPSYLPSLEDARRRISQSVEALRQQDPELYDLVLGAADGLDDEPPSEHLSSSRRSRRPAAGGSDPQWRPLPRQGPSPSGSRAGSKAYHQEEDDEALPNGWEQLETEEGDVYFHSLVTGKTQWEFPEEDAAVEAGWHLFQAEDGHWFYHNPYDMTSLWYPEVPEYAAEPSAIDSLLADASRG